MPTLAAYAHRIADPLDRQAEVIAEINAAFDEARADGIDLEALRRDAFAERDRRRGAPERMQ